MNLSNYEASQVQAIQDWKNDEPRAMAKLLLVSLTPLTWLLNKIVPEAAVRGALDFSSAMAEWMTDTRDIVRDGCVEKLGDLKRKDLKLSDDLADEVHNWAIGIAVAEGAGTGVFGFSGVAVDIPTIITLALRTIHKVGVCYGFECKDELDQKFVLGVLAASSANCVKEREAALLALKIVEVTIAKVTWKKMAQKAAEDRLSKEASILVIKNLAKELGVNLTKRKALASIPVIGAAVGGSVNGWFIKEVGWAARRAFQERWLLENGKLQPE